MNGAWIALLLNVFLALIGVLQAADWVNLVGSQSAGLITAVLAGANAIAHAITPAGPAAKP
jgi:hypothetical protein